MTSRFSFFFMALALFTWSGTGHAALPQSLSLLASPGPLTALHAKYDSACLECHVPGGGVPDTRCLDCHKEVRARVAADKGYHARLEKKCFECHPDHLGRDFDIVPRELLKPEVFKHEVTGFPLEGAHRALECRTCHQERSYLKLQPECSFCHQGPHRGQFENAPCSNCHGPAGNWRPDRFNHEKARFQLEGAHKEAACSACHPDGRFRGRPHRSCADCHREPHRGQFEATACADCHGPAGDWRPDRFNHEKARFQLEGAHKEAACSACHPDGRFRGRPHRSCADCHRDPHGGLRGPECRSCHAPQSWNLDLRVHSEGPFPLEGRHALLACSTCHRDGRFAPLDSRCTACHQDPHRNQFGLQGCEECHAPSGWLPPTFRHIETGFILDGRHRVTDCRDCHRGRNYRNTPTACESCHLDDFRRANDPNHVSARIAGDCRPCHNTTSWRGALYNHPFYLLAGPHNTAVRCNDCHVGGNLYNLSGSRCTGCHPRPLHPGHPHPDGDMPDHTRPHLHGHEPCAKCHFTDSWQNVRFHSMGGG